MKTLLAASCAVSCSAVPAVATPASAAAKQYTVTDLGTLRGTSAEVFSINESGAVVGRSLTADLTEHG
jgi:uncharacterized membrane protein